MAHDVFDERLKQEARDEFAQGLARCVNVGREPIGKTDVHDAEVPCQNLEFGFEPDLLRVAGPQGQAQHVAQAGKHLIRGLDVTMHERRDAVERIEQEMVMELRLQGRQLSLRQLRLELRRAEVARAGAAIVFDCIEQDHEVELVEEHAEHVRYQLCSERPV